MSLQLLQKPVFPAEQDSTMESFVEKEDAESMKENRVVTLRRPKSSGSPLRTLRGNRSPPKRATSDHALQAMKRMREQDNALSSKVIQNLQNDKAAFAVKMEELQSSLQTSQQQCNALQQTMKSLTSDNDHLEESNCMLSEQVEELRECSSERALVIDRLQQQLATQTERHQAEIQQQKMSPTDVELLSLAKNYLRQSSQLRQMCSTQLRPASKSAWQSDSLVAQCNSCNKRFGTFLRRHHCRGCGKLFCAACCQDNLHLLNDSDGSVLGVTEGLAHLSASDEHRGFPAIRQRSCRSCFQQAEELDTRKQLLMDKSKAELQAMEEWLARSGTDFAAFLGDEGGL